MGLVGIVLTVSEINYEASHATESSNPLMICICVTGGGVGTLIMGTNKWRSGKNRQRKIELQVMKYKGSASINGIGFELWF